MPSGRDAEANGTISSRYRPENSEEGSQSDESRNTLGLSSMQQSTDGLSELRFSHHSESKKKNKRKQRHSETVEQELSNRAPAIVEYSDVSSEDLSAPEAGEIQSEDGFNLSEGEVSPQLYLSMRHHSDSHRHSSSSSSKHHRERKTSDTRYLSPSPSEGRHTHRRTPPSGVPLTPSPPPKSSRHKDSVDSRHRKHRDASPPPFHREISDSPTDYHTLKNDTHAMRRKEKKHKRDRKHEKSSRHSSPRKRKKKNKHHSRESSQAATSRNVSPPSVPSPGGSPDAWERSASHKHHSRDSSQATLSRNLSPPGLPVSPRSPIGWERAAPHEESRISFRGTPRTPPLRHGPSTSPVSPPSRGAGSDMDLVSDERDSPSYSTTNQRRKGSAPASSPHTPPVTLKGYDLQVPRESIGGRQTPPSPNRRNISPNFNRRSRSPEGEYPFSNFIFNLIRT